MELIGIFFLLARAQEAGTWTRILKSLKDVRDKRCKQVVLQTHACSQTKKIKRRGSTWSLIVTLIEQTTTIVGEDNLRQRLERVKDVDNDPVKIREITIFIRQAE